MMEGENDDQTTPVFLGNKVLGMSFAYKNSCLNLFPFKVPNICNIIFPFLLGLSVKRICTGKVKLNHKKTTSSPTYSKARVYPLLWY